MVQRLFDPKKPVRWRHPDDDGDPDAMVFEIVPLTEGQRRMLSAAGAEADYNAELISQNVAAIHNVVWPGTTAQVTITTRADKDRFMEYVSADYMQIVYRAILNTGVLLAGQEKNSGGSRGTPGSRGKASTPNDTTARAASTGDV